MPLDVTRLVDAGQVSTAEVGKDQLTIDHGRRIAAAAFAMFVASDRLPRATVQLTSPDSMSTDSKWFLPSMPAVRYAVDLSITGVLPPIPLIFSLPHHA